MAKFREFEVLVSDGGKLYLVDLFAYGSEDSRVNRESFNKASGALEESGCRVENSRVARIKINDTWIDCQKANFRRTAVEFMEAVYSSGILRWKNAANRFQSNIEKKGFGYAFRELLRTEDGKRAV